MKPIKLIAGQMNALYFKCKIGYANGVNKPKRIIKPKIFNQIIILRKAA